MTIIILLLGLSLIVFIHELGHFLMAKANGILVEEFGLGLPPRIAGIKIGETIYSINLLPLGGFVRIYGEDTEEKIDPKLKHRSFISKKPWQKIAVLIAGVIGNFLLGWVLISFIFTQGVPTPTNKVTIQKIQKNTPAYSSGLHVGDIITQIKIKNKVVDVKSPQIVAKMSKEYAGQKITYFVRRDHKKLVISIIPRKKYPKGEGPLGIIITSFEIKKYSWYKAPVMGLVEATSITQKMVGELGEILGRLITFQKTNADITGPIGIVNYASTSIKYGIISFLEFMAILSLNLAIINIFPFPALDGGRVVFVLYEWITGKTINKKIERKINTFGILFLIGVAVIISIKDIKTFYLK